MDNNMWQVVKKAAQIVIAVVDICSNKQEKIEWIV